MSRRNKYGKSTTKLTNVHYDSGSVKQIFIQKWWHGTTYFTREVCIVPPCPTFNQAIVLTNWFLIFYSLSVVALLNFPTYETLPTLYKTMFMSILGLVSLTFAYRMLDRYKSKWYTEFA